MSSRYAQYCPVARALEVVGERWTLLVVRELLLGPRRFTDLLAGLPGISTNVLTGRLKELEQAGLVARRTLLPPAGSTVYELTEAAAGLAAVAAAMAQWGRHMLGRPRPDDEVHGSWLVLGLAVTATATQLPDDTTYELRIEDGTADEVFHVGSRGGYLRPGHGPVANPDAVIHLELATLVAVASGELDVHGPEADQLIAVDGDLGNARRLLEALAASSSAPPPPS